MQSEQIECSIPISDIAILAASASCYQLFVYRIIGIGCVAVTERPSL